MAIKNKNKWINRSPNPIPSNRFPFRKPFLTYFTVKVATQKTKPKKMVCNTNRYTGPGLIWPKSAASNKYLSSKNISTLAVIKPKNNGFINMLSPSFILIFPHSLQ